MKRSKQLNLFFITMCSLFLIFTCDKKKSSTQPEIVDGTSINFTKSDQSLGNTRSFGMAIADIDMDNDNDIFITNYIGPSRLWINNGEGIFTQSNQNFCSMYAHDVAIDDLNGDSFPDIFIIIHNSVSKIFLNDGNGNYNDSGQSIGSPNDTPETIQLIDVDNDNDVDALIYSANAFNRIWINNGSGIFNRADEEYGGNNTKGSMLANFNNDSFPDLYISLRSQSSQLWINDGSGIFTNSEQSLGVNEEHFQSIDIDNDGDIDILETSGNEIRIWLNQNNTANFIEGNVINEGALFCDLFDADKDGDADMVTAHIQNGNKFWLNDGSGIFSSQGTVFGMDRVLRISSGKLNDDDDIDVLLGKLEGLGGNEIYINNYEK